ncbi:MAG: SpoIIIAH-like family protein [Lachnospiraceae bacterium]|nr:SpoIIIAH-like family protein [Lachnospiraceae bacterium]
MKRNQIMITALAIMIAIAGYLNFAGSKISEDVVTADNTNMEGEDVTALLDISEEDIASDIGSLDSEAVQTENYLDDTLVLGDTIENVNVDTASAALEGEDTLENAENLNESTPGEAVYTSTQAVSSLSAVKLLKEQTRAKNKETLLEIINSTSLDESQKQDAVDGMIKITEISEKETAAEILLESKGFAGAVVSISGNMADVVVSADTLTDAQLAQIEDIVIRKTGISAENIVISPLSGK